MPIYAVIENEVVVNKCIADADDVKPPSWVLCDELVDIGWRYVGNQFIKVEPETAVEDMDLAVRGIRDSLLRQSDWTQLADAPVDDLVWAVYRQALRDVPQQEGFPDNVVWPELPVSAT
jgi:hypothetical protein